MIKINKVERNITDTRIESYGILFNNTGKIAIVRKKEGGKNKKCVDVLPSNSDLSSMKVELVNAMSREYTIKNSIEA